MHAPPVYSMTQQNSKNVCIINYAKFRYSKHVYMHTQTSTYSTNEETTLFIAPVLKFVGCTRSACYLAPLVKLNDFVFELGIHFQEFA